MKLLSPGQAARIYNTTAALARWRRRGPGDTAPLPPGRSAW